MQPVEPGSLVELWEFSARRVVRPPCHLQSESLVPSAEPQSHIQAHSTSQLPTPQRQARPPFAHLTSSPNTCASYVQGQDHSPSVTGCAISQSPTAYDLTTSQTSSKCPDDYTNHQLRTAACSQLHDPGVKVRPAFLFIHLLLTSPLVLRSLVREGLLFLNGKFSHL